ncbi:MAG TPA: FAD-binding protein [Rhizomicrobium sp.]|nr:FAD-binding protein [Rhizomicrobium sp.]
MIVSPQNENELADCVRAAAADKRALEIVGHGTKRGLGRAVDAGMVLDLTALSGIVRYEPDELVLTARAATPIAEIEDVLRPKNQRLGFAPADWGPLYGAPERSATIAGVLSADASGSARLRYGAARDHLLGFTAVNGTGEIYKAGGRVVKNVTGFDLPKLFCGAMGTLGPLSEVTLRLVPRAAEAATLVRKDVDAESGLALLRRAWSSPLEATGLAYVPGETARGIPGLGDVGKGAALFRIDGAPLADKRDALTALVGELARGGDELFTHIGSGHAFVQRAGDLWRVFVPPAAAAAFAQTLDASFWLADWAGGVLWIESERSLHAEVTRAGGHAILMRAGSEVRKSLPVFPPESSVRAALTQRVKSAFDPLGLFNPGRMFEGV